MLGRTKLAETWSICLINGKWNIKDKNLKFMWLDVRYTPRPFKYETNIKEKNKHQL